MGELTATLNSPIAVGHSNFLEPTLIFVMIINVGYINIQPMVNCSRKLAWITIIVFLRKLI